MYLCSGMAHKHMSAHGPAYIFPDLAKDPKKAHEAITRILRSVSVDGVDQDIVSSKDLRYGAAKASNIFLQPMYSFYNMDLL